MNMFDEIDKVKKKLPTIKKVTSEVTSHNLNNYQIFALVILGIAVCIGIIFGNLFPSCGTTSGLYSSKCLTTEFNLSLAMVIWFIGLLICVFYYGIGQIISLLDKINTKISK